MDAQETSRVNLRFEAADRFAQQISRRPDVQTDVVAVSFDPINFGSFEKEDAPARFHDDTFKRACAARLLCAEQCSCRLVRLFGTSQLRFGARERLRKPLLIKRLQQIIECARFKRAHGILIVSGYKYYERHVFPFQGL